ncbi:MAG: hypothetical protein EAZ54_09560 [Curvibacter sp.]|nr:MAG: hypothetical protein EAZ54_09560 [Curvibacter sp.]
MTQSINYKEPVVPIPKTSLSAIQNAGAAVHQADASLKAVVQAYADQVRLAMSSNPFDLQADSLFEEWKTVARLSLTLEQIETELRKVHQAAQQLGESGLGSNKSRVRLAAPSPKGTLSILANVPVIEAIEATDVVATKPKKVKAVSKPINARKVVPKAALSPNTQKLWDHLKTVLNAKKFTEIKRTQVGVAAGLPTGSVTASFNKLLENSYLEENASGGLKLISKK